jgi:ATP-dependent DNA helicase RecG
MAKTTGELLRLLVELESDQVERKQSVRNVKDKICQAICAFANDLPEHGTSGVIFVGATDDGRPAGLTVDDRLLLELVDLRDQGQILPPPSMAVSRLEVGGQPVAVSRSSRARARRSGSTDRCGSGWGHAAR